jgi:hypothetical protein
MSHTLLQRRRPVTSTDSLAWLGRQPGLRATEADEKTERARLGPLGEQLFKELRVSPGDEDDDYCETRCWRAWIIVAAQRRRFMF